MNKFDVGRVLQGIFDNFGGLLPLLLAGALVIYLPISIATAVLLSSPDSNSIIFVLLSALLGFLALFWYEAVVTLGVQARQDGQEAAPGPIFATALKSTFPLLGASILAGLGILVGLLLFIVPGLFLITRWSVIVPVIVLEKEPVFGSFGRSGDLVQGSGWQVFAVIVITWVTSALIQQLIQSALGSGDDFAGLALGTFVGGMITAPIASLGAAVTYFELRRLETPAIA